MAQAKVANKGSYLGLWVLAGTFIGFFLGAIIGAVFVRPTNMQVVEAALDVIPPDGQLLDSNSGGGSDLIPLIPRFTANIHFEVPAEDHEERVGKVIDQAQSNGWTITEESEQRFVTTLQIEKPFLQGTVHLRTQPDPFHGVNVWRMHTAKVVWGGALAGLILFGLLGFVLGRRLQGGTEPS